MTPALADRLRPIEALILDVDGVLTDGTIVYGTGYAYSPWIGSVWYPAPYTYGLAAAPVASTSVRRQTTRQD